MSLVHFIVLYSYLIINLILCYVGSRFLQNSLTGVGVVFDVSVRLFVCSSGHLWMVVVKSHLGFSLLDRWGLEQNNFINVFHIISRSQSLKKNRVQGYKFNFKNLFAFLQKFWVASRNLRVDNVSLFQLYFRFISHVTMSI